MKVTIRNNNFVLKKGPKTGSLVRFHKLKVPISDSMPRKCSKNHENLSDSTGRRSKDLRQRTSARIILSRPDGDLTTSANVSSYPPISTGWGSKGLRQRTSVLSGSVSAGASSAGGLDKEHAAISGSVSAEGIDNEKQAEKPCPRNHGQGF